MCENERDKPHLIGKSGEEFRVPAGVLAQYAGTYGTGRVRAIVSVESGRLTIDMGSGKTPLVAHSESNFTMEGTGVEFVKDAQGKVTGMIQHWNESDRNYPRL